MTIDNPNKEAYLSWLLSTVFSDEFEKSEYSNLMNILVNINFDPSIDMDTNRAIDGQNLRYYWAVYYFDKNVTEEELYDLFGNEQCSFLEMMVALCIRIENIMCDERYGNRTYIWFKDMLTSLGLQEFKNNKFDINAIYNAISKFNSRDYSPTGKGGLFTINTDKDMREYELWYQMNFYVEEKDKEERKYERWCNESY